MTSSRAFHHLLCTLCVIAAASLRVAGADLPRSGTSRPAEKLIMGFEASELEDKKEGRTCWTFVEKAEDGVDFYAPFEYGEAGSRAWTWRCRPGQTTEGKLAPRGQNRPE